MTAKKTVRRLQGIVRSMGGAGRRGGWDLVLILSPWRESDGPLVTRHVRLSVPVATESALERALARRREGSAISVAVSTLQKRKGFVWWSALGSGPIRKADPTPFEAEVKRQAEPRTTDDATLGRLQLDRDMGWYQGTRRLGRVRYDVFVVMADLDDDKKVARAIATAAPHVLAVEREWSSICDAVADELLEVHNGVWRQAGKPLSVTAFKKRLAVSELHVASGRTTVYLRSGKLFGDHGVEVRIPHRGKRREILIS